MKQVRQLFVMAVLGSLLTGTMSASIIVSLISVTADGSIAGQFDWTYQATLASDQQMRSTPPAGATRAHDSFIVFDFAGYVAGSISWTPSVGGETWTATTENTSILPRFQGVPDDGTLPNLVVNLVGGADIVPSGNQSVVLGTLTARSTQGQVGLSNGFFSSQATKTQNGTTAGNTSSLEVPVQVPEPATMSLMGLGLIGFGLLARRLNRK